MKEKIISVLLIVAMTIFLAYYCEDTEIETEQPVIVTGEEGHYTYSYADRIPENWSPLAWQSAQEKDVLTYTTSPLYAVALNEDRDGYKIGKMLASAMPEDITEEYAGNKTYGVPEDAGKGYVWEIKLRKDAVWADQTAITAEDFVRTIKICLDSAEQYDRAADFCSGTLALANAEAYVENNYVPVYEDKDHIAEVIDSELYINLKKALPYLDNCSFEEYYQYYSVDYAKYFRNKNGKDLYQQLKTYAEKDTYVKLNQSIKRLLVQYCKNRGIEDEDAYKWLCYYQKDGKKIKWSQVGVFASDKYSVTFVLDAPTTKTALAYALSDLYLVNSTMYDTAGEAYGTAADCYVSYGPYTVTSYDAEQGMTLVKNDSWFGYTDEEFEGQYQTTDIQVRYDLDADEALQLFEQGNLQRTALGASTAKKYAGSNYFYEESAVGSSMYLLDSSLNSLADKETAGMNHRILAYEDFRHAISLIINRSAYAEQFTMGGKAIYGLFNDSYITSVSKDSRYRLSSDSAKSALANLYGLESTKEIKNIKGYDIKAASKLIQSAYDVCLEDGNISDTDQVQLTFMVEDTRQSAEKELAYLQQAVWAAATGTDLEGRITIQMDEQENETPADICKTTWYGNVYDPYNSISTFCSSEITLLNDFTPAIQKLSLGIGEEKVTHSIDEWQEALSAEYSLADSKVRNKILGNLERRVLESYMVIPLYEDSENCLYSQRITNGSEVDVNAELGYGGVRYMTYSMDDAEWADYCAQENYQLEYK